MVSQKEKFYRCHSTHDRYSCKISQLYGYVVNHVKNNNIFPVLSVIVYIPLQHILFRGSFCYQTNRNIEITYPCRGEAANNTSAGGEGDPSG